MVQRTLIESSWRVKELQSRGTSEASDLPWLPAQVPGHVHLDLMRAGVIGDPFYRLAERSAAWIDETDWVYETTFHLDTPAAAHTYLLFHGLDTIAEITLNGEPLGETDNMFIPHQFLVGDKLRAGEGEAGDNTLQVVFRSALRVGADRQKAWNEMGIDPMSPHWFVWGPRSFVRKAQYMYGWDWGPELLSCGIWRPVELVEVPVARLLDWKYEVEFGADDSALVRIETFVERAPGAAENPLTLTAAVLNVGTESSNMYDDDILPGAVSASVAPGEGRVSAALEVRIENARRWWPNGRNGYGTKDQPLFNHPTFYTLHLTLEGEEFVEERLARIGLRTVELVREPDEDGQGEGFKFRINGEDIFIKGANWIPADSFPSRLDNEPDAALIRPRDSRVSDLVRAACDAGFNMLRIWGGGLYESDHFYELCDEHGLLVWQDFPYGCAYYPDTGPYAEAARAEAIAAVRRLRIHPSLALWCGNNENQTMFHDGWEGEEGRAPRYLGENLYHKILPAIIETEDPGRPYWPSSPFGGENPNSEEWGDRHDWDVWHGRGDWIYYREDHSRFVSEFGFGSSCGMDAWDKCLAPADRWPHSPAVRWHDKTRKGYDTYLGFIALHFPEPQTLSDLVYYSQLNQAEALKCGLEHWRRQKGRCWGLLFWQINDCWPVQSWSIIDSEGERKAAYYSVKRAYQPVLLSLLRQDDRVEAHLANDWTTAVSGTVTLSVKTFDGETLVEETSPAEVGANGTSAVAELDLTEVAGQERDVYVTARFEMDEDSKERTMSESFVYGDVENLLLLAEPKDLRLPDPGIHVRATGLGEGPGVEGFTLQFTAKRFAPYVWWRVPGRMAEAGEPPWVDNFFHLQAGQTRSFNIYFDGEDIQTVDDLLGRLEVRSL